MMTSGKYFMLSVIGKKKNEVKTLNEQDNMQ